MVAWRGLDVSPGTKFLVIRPVLAENRRMDMPEHERAIITFVGDFMIQNRARNTDVELARELIADADLRIGNVDTVLSEAGTPSPKWSCVRGAPESVAEIKAMGFNIVTLANNHSMDFGPEGLLDMLERFVDEGVLPVGAGINLDYARKPQVVQVGSQKIAFFSVACTLPPGSAAGHVSPGVAPIHVHQAYRVDVSLAAEQPGTSPGVKTWVDESDLEAMTREIGQASCIADRVVVAIHWGVPRLWRTPFEPRVQDYQRVLGRALIDAGADAVIGNHPHELHELEFYSGKPIAFSLGNFWIDSLEQRTWMARESVAIRLSFAPGFPVGVEVLPILLSVQGFPEYDPESRSVEILDDLSLGVQVSHRPEGRWHRITESPGTANV